MNIQNILKDAPPASGVFFVLLSNVRNDTITRI